VLVEVVLVEVVLVEVVLVEVVLVGGSGTVLDEVTEGSDDVVPTVVEGAPTGPAAGWHAAPSRATNATAAPISGRVIADDRRRSSGTTTPRTVRNMSTPLVQPQTLSPVRTLMRTHPVRATDSPSPQMIGSRSDYVGWFV
jgi:hypothetical protein